MPLVTNFNTAKIEDIVLAKVGNPQRGETLKMSKELCKFGEDDAPVLTFAFLKPFKNVDRYNFHHHSDIELNELYGYTDTIFNDRTKSPSTLILNLVISVLPILMGFKLTVKPVTLSVL